MKLDANFAPLCQAFFSKRLMAQRNVSPHTVSAYAQTFRLLARFAQQRLGIPPSKLSLEHLDAPFLAAFLDDLESDRSNGARSRNARLAALRSFYRYAALEAPHYGELIQRALAVPYKRTSRRLIAYLTRPEIEAVLASVDRKTWRGRRDYALLLVAVQTGLRLSEITGLKQNDVMLGASTYIRCEGKGRKERCTPITKTTADTLRAWIDEQTSEPTAFLFSNRDGGRLSADAVQRLVAKQVELARWACPSLAKKHVSPHVLRHYAGFRNMPGGTVYP